MNIKDLFKACACELDTHDTRLSLSEISVSTSSVQVYDELALLHFNLGCSLQEDGKLAEAINCYRNVLEVDSTHGDAQYNLANALHLSGRIKEAEIEYTKMIAINPQHQLAYYNLGYIYFHEMRDPWKGIEMLKKSLEIDPNDIDAQINLALALNDMGMIEDVIKCYQYIVEHNNTCVMAFFNLGNAYLDAGRIAEALAAFQVQQRHASRTDICMFVYVCARSHYGPCRLVMLHICAAFPSKSLCWIRNMPMPTLTWH